MAKPSTQAPSGVVSSVHGRAQVIRQGQETAEALQVGDTLMPGDRLLGSADASLQIAESTVPGAQVWNLAFNEAGTGKGKAAAKPVVNGESGKSLDDVIGALERGEEEDATAAGLTGGDGAAMGEGLRVDRVVEVVTPQSLNGAPNGDGQETSIKSTTLLDDGNQAPVFVDGGAGNFDPATGNYRFTTDEDVPVSGQVKASDADGDPLTFVKGSDPAHGTVVVNADGSWTYTPNKDFNGPDVFTVTVSDGKGGTATSTVYIGVNPVNDPPKFDDPNNPNYDPVTGNYKATTDEDTPVSGKVKASDADGDPLTFSKGSNPEHGTVVVNADGSWTYTPNKDYNGPDSFTVTVSDGKGGTATSTVNIGVNPVNDPPKFDDPNNPNYDPVTGNYSATTPEDTHVSGQVKAKDADGDALTFAKGSNPAHGTVTVDANGNWTYTPSKDYNGSDSFTITVSDGKGGTATSTVNIGVTPVNDPPKFDDPSNPNYDPFTGNYKATTDEDKPVSGTVKATDVDGDPLTFAKGSNPAHGTVTVDANGNWTYTPSKDYNGPDSFTVTVSDGKGGTATSTVNIGVTPVNDPPKFDDPSNPNYNPSTGNYHVTTDEDKPVSGKVKATDADGDPLTYAKGSNPAHGAVTVDANGNWTYTPSKDYNGSDSFTVTVSDGKGGTTTSTIYVGITPVNDAPTVTVSGSATVSEEGLAGGNPDTQGSSDTTNAREASGHVTVSDVDSGSVSLTLSGPSGLTSGGVAITWSGNGTAASPLIGSAGGKVILTATIDNAGDYKVTLSGPVDHADTTKEDTRAINLTVNANDGQATTKATLPVIVEDDSPLSGSQNINVSSQTGSQDTNLMLIVDTSGSMKDRLADMTVNGLKAAIKTLIDRYDDLGDVKIQLVTFGDGAKGQSVWMTIDQAKTLINSLKGEGGTNYDGALAAARTAFGTSGKITGGVNVSYFITDGQPSKGQALDSKDETSWETFLSTNKIDSYAIGTGSLTSTHVSAIEPVAYNGITGTEKAAVTLGTNAELGNYLLDTVPVIQKGTLAGLAGADGLQRIESFTASGQLGSSLDSSGKVLTIQLKSGGTMQVNLETGEFTLSQPHNATTNETFSYTLVDKDGDRGTGTVSLTAQNTSPEGTDATITLLEDGKHTFSASNFGFHDADAGDKLQAVRIDALPAHGTLTLNGVAVTAGQVISASQLDKLVFTPVANAHGTGYAQISFSVQDNHGTFDVSANTLKFNVTPVNDAPQAFASNSGHNLLGLVDLTVNPLLNLSKTQQVAVNDVDNNLVRVEVQVDTLLSLGRLLGDHSSLSISHDAALNAGLKITGNDSRHIVIESIHDGGTVDITQVNKLLATLTYDPADILGVSVDLFPSLKITATDSFGAHDTACVSSSIVAVGVDVAPVITTVETVVHVAGEHAAQLGTEVFQWHLADHPANGGCVDTIHGFDGAARNVGGDVLDLRDLLSGSTHVSGSNSADMDKLLAHLDFDTQSQPGSTVIHVSASGGFHADASGNSVTNGCGDQQHIVLANVDIRASLGLDAQASDHQIIAELMQRGKLLVDQA